MKIIDVLNKCLESDNPFDLYWFLSECRQLVMPYDTATKDINYDTEFNDRYNAKELDTLTLIANTWNLAPNIMGVSSSVITYICGKSMEYKVLKYSIKHYRAGLYRLNGLLTKMRKSSRYVKLTEEERNIFKRYCYLVKLNLQMLDKYKETDRKHYCKFIRNSKWQREVFLMEHVFNRSYKYDGIIESIIKKLEGDV